MTEDSEARPLDQPDDRLLPSSVREVLFSGSGLLRRGYDAYEVDAFLARVESEIAMLLDERAALAAEVERLQARIRGSGPTTDDRGHGRRSREGGDSQGRRALIRSYLDALARQVDEQWDRIDPARQPELDQPAVDAGTSSAPDAVVGGLRSSEQWVSADGQRSGQAPPAEPVPSRRHGLDSPGDAPTSELTAVVPPGHEQPAPVVEHDDGPHGAGSAAPATAVPVDAGTRGLEHQPSETAPPGAGLAPDEADGETRDAPASAVASLSPGVVAAASSDDERVAWAARSLDDGRDAGGTSRAVSAAEDSGAALSAELPTPQAPDEAAQVHDSPASATGDEPATAPAPRSDAVEVPSVGAAAGEADAAPPAVVPDEPRAAVEDEGGPATVPTSGPDPATTARASKRTRERKKITMHSRPRPR